MEKFKLSPVDTWVVPSPLTFTEADNTSSPYFYILIDYQELITDSESYKYKRTVEKINDESRIEDASLYIVELQDSNHQIVFHSVEIIRNGHRFSVLQKDKISVHQREKALENHVTDKMVTVSLSIDDLRVGDIIDYQATTISYADEHPLQGKFYHSLFWLRWGCAAYRQRIRIINQSSQSIDIQECPTDNNMGRVTSLTVLPNENYEKEYRDLGPVVFENIVPNWVWPDYLLATTKASWQELSAYLFHYYESNDIYQKNLKLDGLVVFDSNETIEAKIVKTVRFVQNDIRYKGEHHGIFTHTPKKPDEVAKNRYGDCKDKANLLVSLLRNIGIEAHLTIVNTNYGIKIEQLSPSLYHFNHMIVHIEFNHKDYFFDPTIKKQAGDLFNSATLDYGYGLILSKAGHLLKKLPHDCKRRVFSLKHIFDFSKTLSNDNRLTIRRSFYAHRANNMRYYLNSKEQELISNEFLRYAQDDSDLDLTVVRPMTIVKDDSVRNILDTEEIYTINNLTDADHNKAVQVPTTIYMDFPTTASYVHPIRIDLDGGVVHEIEVVYKDKRDVPKCEEEKIIENQWFFYHDTVSAKDNKIFFRSSTVPYRRFVESRDIKTYAADVEQVRQRCTSNFPYKTGNYASIYKMAGNMALSASLIFIIMLFFVKFQ